MATSKHFTTSDNEKIIDTAPAPQKSADSISTDITDNIVDTDKMSIDNTDNSADNTPQELDILIDNSADNSSTVDDIAPSNNVEATPQESAHYKAKRTRDLAQKNDSDNLGDKSELLDNDGDSDISTKPTRPTTLDDIDDDDKEEIDYNERVKIAMENNPQEPCKRNKALDEKISKYSSYGCIPFFLISIGFSLFNIGRVRHPWSFLFLSLATTVLCVGNILRYRNNKKCSCSICETQGRTLRNTALIWLLASIGLMIAFIVFLFIKK